MVKVKINGRILEFGEDNITLDLIDCKTFCLGEGASEHVAFNFNISGNVNIVGNFYNSGDFNIRGDLVNNGGFYNGGNFNVSNKFSGKKPHDKKAHDKKTLPPEKPTYRQSYATVTLKGKTIKVPRSQG